MESVFSEEFEWGQNSVNGCQQQRVESYRKGRRRRRGGGGGRQFSDRERDIINKISFKFFKSILLVSICILVTNYYVHQAESSSSQSISISNNNNNNNNNKHQPSDQLQARRYTSNNPRLFVTSDLNEQTITRKQNENVPKPKVCQVKDGESVAIVEIEESRGSDISQLTNPIELPISGSVEAGEIELKIESETFKYFNINNKRLQLNRALNRDAVIFENSTNGQVQQQAISSIYLQISCLDKRTSEDDNQKKVIIPVLVKVIDINDNVPKFSSSRFTIQVSEFAPIGTVLIGPEQLKAIDLDSANNGQIEYTLLPFQQQSYLSSNNQNKPAEPKANRFTGPTTAKPRDQLTSSVHVSTVFTRRLNQTNQSKKPTINLMSEPILNGPIEEKDEEESDESLLASLMTSTESVNSPDTETEDPDSDDSSLVFGASQLNGRRVFNVRHKRWQPTTTAQKQQQESTTTEPKSFVTTTTTAAAITTTTAKDVTEPSARDMTTLSKGSLPLVSQLPSSTSGTKLPWTNLMAANENMNAQQVVDTYQQEDLSDPADFFALEITPWGPAIKLKRQLDFETRQMHQLTIMATDRATNKSERLSSSAGIIIKVLDGDDQGPAFFLDQSGCATNAIPSIQSERPTTSLAGLMANNPFEASKFIQSDLIVASSKRLAGLKVTDLSDDFDFSDSADRVDQQIGSPSHGLIANPHGSSRSREHARPISTIRPPEYSCLPPFPYQMGSNGIAEYFASVMAGDSDQLIRILPQAIRARDRDQLNAPIRYSFINGTPSNYSQYFQINPLDAWVKQIAPIDRISGKPDKFIIWLEAQEQTPKHHSTLAKLTIEVSSADWSPPSLITNSASGFVEENEPIGTKVRISQNGETKLMQIFLQESKGLTDKKFVYEFETTSDAFKVDRDGFVYVNRSPLDADEPSRNPVYMFQVTAKLSASNSHSSGGFIRTISNPLSINVTLLDINDNGPIISNHSIQSPIKLTATSQSGQSRLITTIQVEDRDSSAENTRASFHLLHVSNGGRDRFRLDESSGELRALGKFIAGEQFSLTVQVSDAHGRSSQSILDIIIVPGQNTGAPQFISSAASSHMSTIATGTEQLVSLSSEHSPSRILMPTGDFSTDVVEALAPQSAVFQLHAFDPENDQISYSILGGNINNDFYINPKTGIVYLNNKLDREEVSRYQLLVQAKDSGGLSTTRSLRINVLDTNDENPTFTKSVYEFQIQEDAKKGSVIGQVKATDGDAGENGEISYSLESGPLIEEIENGHQVSRSVFDIDQSSGDIRLMGELDYEKVKSYSLIVKAKDHDKNPRSGLANVIIKVLDSQDEKPYFKMSKISVKVWENRTILEPIAQVEASDPDSISQITYEIKWSSDQTKSLFLIDTQTGSVTLNGRLDFELVDHYTLLVGTVENHLNQSYLDEWSNRLGTTTEGYNIGSPICRIDIQVLDLNDNAPQFVNNQLMPMRIKNSAHLGSQIIRLEAKDNDGSEPNNLIRYEILETPSKAFDSYCSEYFIIDQMTGIVSVKSDLRTQKASECQLEIKAKDLGIIPGQLQSNIVLTIFIDHIAELPTLTSMIGFADSQFTVEIDEKAKHNSLVKILPVVNKLKIAFPMNCEIISGNDQGKFYVTQNGDRDCEVRLRETQMLDYEQQQRYSLLIRLNTIGTASALTVASNVAQTLTSITPNQPAISKSITRLNINIIDRNDNRPIFKAPSRYAHLTQGRFLAGLSANAPTDTQVIQVRATDLDSPTSNGLVSYELLNESELEFRFKVDPLDGIVRTSRPIEDLPLSRFPLNIRVLARDNPERGSQEALESVAEILLNLIQDEHRLALVLRDTPTSRVLELKEEILSILQERSGLIPGYERAESMKLRKNNFNGLEPDVNSTDFWFYLIEPGSFRLVAHDDPRVHQTLLDRRAQISLNDVIAQHLKIEDVKVRLPFSVNTVHYLMADDETSFPGSIILQSIKSQYSLAGERIGGLLISAAIVIAFICITILIFQCGSRSASSRREKHNRSMNKQLGKLAATLMQRQAETIAPQTYFLPFNNSQQHHKSMNIENLETKYPPIGSAFSTIPSVHQDQLCSTNSDQSLINSNNKEYETQMLKMAVMFDDNNSVEEHNLNEKAWMKNCHRI